MNLTIFTWREDLLNVQVDATARVEDLKAILEAQTSLPQAQQTLVFHEGVLQDGATLTSCGVGNGDVLQLMPKQAAAQQQQQQGPSAQASSDQELLPDGSAKNPIALMARMRADAHQMMQMEHSFPALVKAIREEDISAFQEALRALRRAMGQRSAKEEELRRYQALAEDDPFNPDVQRKIEELIQQSNIDDNYEQAMEHAPEVFSQVCMLYVDMEVNGVAVKTFVDSGAQMTIMTQTFAEKCYLTRLIDKRYQGMAVGVGSSKIIGRIHQTPMRIAGHYITSSITVLEQKSGPQFIFGLDNLKRHLCSIDLKTNELVFGSCDAKLPFLPESAIPVDPQAAVDSISEEEAKHKMEQDAKAEGGGPSTAPAPASAAPAAPAAGRLPGAPDPAVPDPMAAKVEKLMALGFLRAQCEAALKMAGGNEEYAAAVLFEQQS